MLAFDTLGLLPPLARAIEVLGFTSMTPVQAHALPAILEGRDVTAQARTGSGKTLALAVGILTRVDLAESRVQGLVVCPTRELAEQVSTEIRRLAKFMPNLKLLALCGGMPAREQVPSLTPPPHVVVATPGRLRDHLKRGTVALDGVRVLVLDEADRMLDMGFADAIAHIVAETPKSRQTLMFSATFPESITALARGLSTGSVGRKPGGASIPPLFVKVDTTHDATEIEQLFFRVSTDFESRLETLRALLLQYHPDSALVFCHTREDTRGVAAALAQRGFSALALNGEMEQKDRDEVLLRFANGSCSVLVATDVAARGLDIKALGAVVAWELPKDPDVHIHRIGRTGRAGLKGLALSLCTSRDTDRVQAIAERQGIQVKWTVPEPVPARVAPPMPAPMRTLIVEGGRQDKLRAGDVLGALCGDVGLSGDDIGKIDVGASRTYVAVRRAHVKKAYEGLRAGKIKGRSFRVWFLE